MAGIFSLKGTAGMRGLESDLQAWFGYIYWAVQQYKRGGGKRRKERKKNRKERDTGSV
jgi:hypothetical protein